MLDESGGIDFFKDAIRGVDSLKVDPYFLKKGLAELLLRTDLPEKVFSSPDVSPILEIVLPHGLLVSEGQSISLMYVIDIPLHFEMSGCDVPDIPGPTGRTLRDLVYAVFAVSEFGVVFEDRIFSYTCLTPSIDGRDWNPSDVHQSLRSIALNLLLLLKEYPEYVTVASGAKGKSGFGSGSGKDQKIAPRVI